MNDNGHNDSRNNSRDQTEAEYKNGMPQWSNRLWVKDRFNATSGEEARAPSWSDEAVRSEVHFSESSSLVAETFHNVF
jgi:hypothetical protein